MSEILLHSIKRGHLSIYVSPQMVSSLLPLPVPEPCAAGQAATRVPHTEDLLRPDPRLAARVTLPAAAHYNGLVQGALGPVDRRLSRARQPGRAALSRTVHESGCDSLVPLLGLVRLTTERGKESRHENLTLQIQSVVKS